MSIASLFRGQFVRVSAVIRALVDAGTVEESEREYWLIDNATLVQGRLSQSSAAVAAVPLCGLKNSSGWSRICILDLLAEIADGCDDHVDVMLVGPV